MKLPEPITGTIDKVHTVRQVKNGYTQTVVVHQPEVKNGQGYKLSNAQWFVVHIWSNKQDDSRFLKPEHIGAQCAASVYLDGQRWQGRTGFEYNNKLNLDKWIEENPKP